jgi:hypothetical protein
MQSPRIDAGELEVIDGSAIRPEAWDAVVAGLKGHFVQSHAWSRCMGRLSGAACHYAILRRGGAPAAAGWYAVGSTRLGPIALSASLDMESLPGFDGSRITAGEVLCAVRSLARRHGAGEIRFGNSPAEYGPALPGEGIVEKVSFTIDLTRPREVLFGNLSARVKRKLGKADRQGIVSSCISRGDDPALDLVRPLFEHTITKHIAQGKSRDLKDKDFFLHAVRELIGCGSAVLFMAFRGSDPLSCVLLSIFDRHAVYLFGGSAPEGYRMNASYPVIWKAITGLQDRGVLSLSLGEVPAAARDEQDRDHGLYWFKKEFGSSESQVYSGRIVTRPLQQRCLAAARNVKRALSALRPGTRGPGTKGA